MTNMKNLVLALGTLALIGDGCATFRAGPGTPISMGPATKGGAKTISVVVTGASEVSGQQIDVPANMLNLWRDVTLRAYQEAGVFATVTPGLGTSDLRSEVRILDRGQTGGMPFLTGFTMFIIPCSATDTFVITTTVRDAGGNVIGNFEKSEAVTTYFQLFMVFTMPGHTPGSVAESVLIDLNRATIAEAQGRGIF